MPENELFFAFKKEERKIKNKRNKSKRFTNYPPFLPFFFWIRYLIHFILRCKKFEGRTREKFSKIHLLNKYSQMEVEQQFKHVIFHSAMPSTK